MPTRMEEWCHDWYDADYYNKGDKTNPTGPATGTYRVVRGGHWNDKAYLCRAASRNNHGDGDPDGINGFRIARSP